MSSGGAVRRTHGGTKAREIECRGGPCAFGTDSVRSVPRRTLLDMRAERQRAGHLSCDSHWDFAGGLQMRIINKHPDRGRALVLGALPFIILAALYLIFSAVRLAENPNDKLLPSLASLAGAIARVALHPERVSGEIVLWADTLA